MELLAYHVQLVLLRFHVRLINAMIEPGCVDLQHTPAFQPSRLLLGECQVSATLTERLLMSCAFARAALLELSLRKSCLSYLMNESHHRRAEKRGEEFITAIVVLFYFFRCRGDIFEGRGGRRQCLLYQKDLRRMPESVTSAHQRHLPINGVGVREFESNGYVEIPIGAPVHELFSVFVKNLEAIALEGNLVI